MSASSDTPRLNLYELAFIVGAVLITLGAIGGSFVLQRLHHELLDRCQIEAGIEP